MTAPRADPVRPPVCLVAVESLSDPDMRSIVDELRDSGSPVIEMSREELEHALQFLGYSARNDGTGALR